MAKRESKETEIWAADSEDDSHGTVYLINFFDGKKHHTFKNRADAIAFLGSIRGHTQIWATNLGYDLGNIFGQYLSLLEMTYIGSRVISARLLGSNVVFKDTLNHWKISVKEMGLRIGLKKLDPKPGKNGKKNFNNVRYCRRDTKITWLFVKSMAEKYQGIDAKLKTTIGSTSIDLFYKKFHSRPTFKEIPKAEEMEFLLTGYYGGRTEIFFNKPVEGNIQYVDVNSLYPSVMRDFGYPTLKQKRFTKDPNFENEGMCEVTLRAPDLRIPYLPYRDLAGKRLIFPNGQFRGAYTYFEIRRAMALGYELKKVHRALEYFGGLYAPFKKFVETLYSERLKAQANNDVLLSDTLKLNLNNLYGKFGQGNEIQKLIPFDLSTLKNGDTIMGDLVLRTEKGDYPRHANGIWASYTTAYARDRLYSGLVQVERENGLLMYCDTDSIIFESDKEIFKDSKALGEFKLEGVFKYAHFKLPKLYALVEADGSRKVRAKGVPRASAAEFFDTGTAHFERPYKIREVVRRNLSPKRKLKLVVNDWQSHSRTISKKYDKRIVLRDGSTRALTL